MPEVSNQVLRELTFAAERYLNVSLFAEVEGATVDTGHQSARVLEYQALAYALESACVELGEWNSYKPLSLAHPVVEKAPRPEPWPPAPAPGLDFRIRLSEDLYHEVELRATSPHEAQEGVWGVRDMSTVVDASDYQVNEIEILVEGEWLALDPHDWDREEACLVPLRRGAREIELLTPAEYAERTKPKPRYRARPRRP